MEAGGQRVSCPPLLRAGPPFGAPGLTAPAEEAGGQAGSSVVRFVCPLWPFLGSAWRLFNHTGLVWLALKKHFEASGETTGKLKYFY